MKAFFTLLALIMISIVSGAQDDLLNEMEKRETAESELTMGTFHGTRLINGHSIETKHKGSLEFIITHRFGRLNSGGYELWGLDASSIRIGLEYGITDRLGVGIGRSSFDKTFDYYAKYKLLRQSKEVPVTISALATASFKASMREEFPTLNTGDKMSYVAQMLIARKFSSKVSFQIMPSFLHQKTVDKDTVVNNLLSLGMGGRVKITRSMAVIGEYYLRLNEKKDNPYNDSIGLGIEFDTGGHVFQLVFTNSIGMVERHFMGETRGDFFEGDVHFGFNITRTFQLGGKK
jgi:hypothetical protein